MAGIDAVDEFLDMASDAGLSEPPDLAICRAPAGGLWRVGKAVAPLRASRTTPEVQASARQGNRFDTADFGVVYMGSTLDACFGETLARYRPKPSLADLVREDWQGFMGPGQVAAEWREKRATVHITPAPNAMFVDIEALQTREYLRKALALGLSALGYEDLDVPVVRGADRRVTRLIAQWTYQQVDESEQPRYAGIRYLSRLNTDWECWALFEDMLTGSPRVESIPANQPNLMAVASGFGIHVH
jgi:hypothetical protein